MGGGGEGRTGSRRSGDGQTWAQGQNQGRAVLETWGGVDR